VGKLKQLQTVKAPLRILEHATLVEVARLERELALDDVSTDGLIALDIDRSDMRDRTWRGRKCQRGALSVGPIVLGDIDLRIRIAVIFQLVECHLVGRHDELAIPWIANLDRHLLFESVEVWLGNNVVESNELDRRDLYRFALGNRHR